MSGSFEGLCHHIQGTKRSSKINTFSIETEILWNNYVNIMVAHCIARSSATMLLTINGSLYSTKNAFNYLWHLCVRNY